MLEYANIWEKTVIHLAIETGLRVSDLLALRRSDIENLLQQELPSTMEVQTKKEGVLARIFISGECAEVLKLYLPTLPDRQKRLLVKDEDTLNKSIQRLFTTAFSTINFKHAMHDFRRMFISTAANLNVNEWRIKYFVGKTVSPDILTYLRNQDLKEDFNKIKTRLTVQTNLKAGNHELLNEMQVTASKQQA
jgi:integrase